MKYLLDVDIDRLYRVSPNGDYHVWIESDRTWNRLPKTEYDFDLALFEKDPSYEYPSEKQAKESFPAAFDPTTPNSVKRIKPKKVNPRFEQTSPTVVEVGVMESYYSGGKTFRQYMEEQNVPPTVAGRAQQIWIGMANQQASNPSVGFDSPNEWA